jgi:hypothetical protein
LQHHDDAQQPDSHANDDLDQTEAARLSENPLLVKMR